MKSDLDHALEYHSEAFPGFATWLAENPGQMKFIKKTIGHFTREQLKQATLDMYGADSVPQGYSKHARELKRLANERYYGGTTTVREYGPKLRDGELVSSCPRCQDYGKVSVVNPSTLKRIRASAGDVIKLHNAEAEGVNTCVLACDCKAGEGRDILRWAEGHCLVEYTQLQNRACERMRAKEFTDFTEAMWAESKRQVLERDEELRPKAVPLDEVELP